VGGGESSARYYYQSTTSNKLATSQCFDVCIKFLQVLGPSNLQEEKQPNGCPRSQAAA
jgi:hypothetical protein